MRFFLATRPGWPVAGLAFAVGLLVGDAAFVARPVFGWFEEQSLWPLGPLLTAFGAYTLFGVGVDLATQLLWPAARRSPLRRVAALAAVGAGLTLEANEARSLLLFAVGAAFTLLALGRFTWPLAALAAAAALWPAAVRPAPPPVPALVDAPAAAPSFVVVVLDTVRRERTSAYGHPRETTPHLRRLAARGVRFDRAYTTGSWSLPSHASLFTGLATERHGAHNEHLSLAAHLPTLAGTLAEHGYETVGFSGNPWLGHGTGMARGFHRMHEPWREVHMKWFLLAWRVWAGLAAPDRDKGGAATVAGVRAWWASRDPARPYLLFVNLMEAHGPYQDVPRASRRRFTDAAHSLRDLESIGMRGWEAAQNGEPLAEAERGPVLDLYDGAIHAADAYLGAILDVAGEGAVVTVLADHGEYAGEKTLYGHPSLLYEGSLRIPFVMAGGPLPAGVRVETLVSPADVMPTLLGIAGIPAPARLDGRDLRHAVAAAARGEPALPRTLAAEAYRPPDTDSYWPRNRPEWAAELVARKRAVLRGTHKRIVGENGTDLVFDLAADPGEEQPLPPDRARRVSLAARVPEPPGAAAAAAAPLDEGARRALDALGYVERR